MEGILSLFFLFFFPHAEAKALPDIFLYEIAITGGTGHTNDDYVELYNGSDDCVDISEWQLRKKTSSGSESSLAVLPKDTFIAPRDTFVWANSKGAWAGIANHTTSATLAKDNSTALYTGTEKEGGKLVDSVSWGDGEPFDPDAKIFDDNPEEKEALARADKDHWKKDFGAPDPHTGATCTPKPKELPPLVPIPVQLSEILANPKGDEHQEFIELQNSGSTDFDLSSYILKDASETGQYVFPDGSILAAHSFLVLTRDVFKFALNNSGEMIYFLDPYARELERVALGSAKENVSLSHTASGWRGTNPTPEKENEDPSLPRTKETIPKTGYVGTRIEFSAEPKKKNSKNFKYTWDFGDGHKSYLKNTSHVYEKKDTYEITLTVSDGKP